MNQIPKRIFSILFSSRMTAILLFILATSMACATFIEEFYDTEIAKQLVYQAKWFELIFILLVINLIGHIRQYKMLSRKKWAGFTFHIAFIVIIIGAGVTRYFGFEGMMHIRENGSSDVIYSSVPYFQVTGMRDNEAFSIDRPVDLSESFPASFNIPVSFGDNGKITLAYKEYFKNAVEKIIEDQKDGSDMIEIEVTGKMENQLIILKKGETRGFGNLMFSFDDPESQNAFRFFEKENKIYFTAPTEISKTMMHGGSDPMTAPTMIPVTDSAQEFSRNYLYQAGELIFVFKGFFKNAKVVLAHGMAEEEGTEMLVITARSEKEEQDIQIPVSYGFAPVFRDISIGGHKLSVAYGNKEIKLPFSLQLTSFTLERYSGSMSPSSYSSEVLLIDKQRNIKEEYRIYMNNVLDYRGYRFFQSSYDRDEKGTVLSVSHDKAGTWISYCGYTLLGIGFFLTLLNKNSRFHHLSQSIRKLRQKRKGIIVTLLFLLAGSGNVLLSQTTQSPVQKPVNREHADRFGHLIVQTFDGRFEPLNTLAMDVIHKLSRKDKMETAKGETDAMQVFLDVMLDPVFWKQQKMILVREKAIRDIIGADGKYAAFNDFIDQTSNYKLATYAENAFRKKPSEQNTFDKEILKVDERVNIMITLLNGSLLRIFPLKGSMNNKWINLGDSLAYVRLPGEMEKLNEKTKVNPFTYSNILRTYFLYTHEATKSGDYSKADEILNLISQIQKTETESGLLPTDSRVNLEIQYNKSQIFVFLRNIYGLLSLILLILAFIDNFRTKKSRVINLLLYFFIGMLGLAFLYHTYGMILRWYLSGHAPWSNGYEALLLIAWASLLAGFTFVRYSKITVAATALLACSVLMTASHSSYDPQLTNLVPVLKSYWLVIHVAVITISYGFLALGFILGLFNLIIFLFSSGNTRQRSKLLIEELTLTNEMSLSVGLFLATLGTFLGGVWANESWGRYWGWDAKETWALIIVITYAIILHLRLIPGLKSLIIFNAATVIGFGSVLMTFFGVNYYLSKGLHSYASDEKSVFPIWAWLLILALLIIIAAAIVKEKAGKKRKEEEKDSDSISL